MVQLRLHVPILRVWVRSLAGELRSHMPCSQKIQDIKQKQYCHKFNKIFKTGVHIKKIKYINKITLKKKISVLVVLCGAPLKTGELVFRPGHGFCWSCPQHPCSSYPGPTPLPSSWGPSHTVRLCLGGEVSGWFVF